MYVVWGLNGLICLAPPSMFPHLSTALCSMHSRAMKAADDESGHRVAEKRKRRGVTLTVTFLVLLLYCRDLYPKGRFFISITSTSGSCNLSAFTLLMDPVLP